MDAIIQNIDTDLAPADVMALAGEYANQAAQSSVFVDYTSRKAKNTIKAHKFDLASFSEFLSVAGIPSTPDASLLQTDPRAWSGVSWGMVSAFVKWQLGEGYSIGSINRRLSTVKTYAKLATQAGVLDAETLTMIRTVAGYSQKEKSRVDEQRETTRRSTKRAESTPITDEQARSLKSQPGTPQGRRDALMLCLLLDHGLRASEVSILKVKDFDLKQGELTFVRPKVGKEGKHKLTSDALRAIHAWVNSKDCPDSGPVLRGSRRGGKLTDSRMSETAISERVADLGKRIEVEERLSAHDCRHYCATVMAARGYDIKELCDWFGWNSPAMAMRYIHSKEVQERYKG